MKSNALRVTTLSAILLLTGAAGATLSAKPVEAWPPPAPEGTTAYDRPSPPRERTVTGPRPYAGTGEYYDSGAVRRTTTYGAGAVVITTVPPPVRVERRPPAPRADYVYQDGYWRWNGRKYIWVTGTWVAAPYRKAVWVPGHYDKVRGGYVWVEGHWRR